MMSENPWEDIETPSMASAVSARRVDAESRWDFFWARGTDRKVLLTLRHDEQSSPTTPLPELRDIEVVLSPPGGDGRRLLGFKLLDPAQQDIFHSLCKDILSTAERAESEAQAVSVALLRTWRWHYLLRGGGTLLSLEEQKGLLGELFVLERFLLPNMSASDAVNAWRGPLGSPKDFEIGRVAIEAKARRGGATPYIAITSESQLDESGVDSLFMYVVELDEAPDDSVDAVNVKEVVDRLCDHIKSIDITAANTFETLTIAAGVGQEDDYSSYRWLEGESRLYCVTGGFPRITWREIRSGVSRVRYTVSLVDCEPFVTSECDLTKVLAKMGGSCGH